MNQISISNMICLLIFNLFSVYLFVFYFLSTKGNCSLTAIAHGYFQCCKKQIRELDDTTQYNCSRTNNDLFLGSQYILPLCLHLQLMKNDLLCRLNSVLFSRKSSTQLTTVQEVLSVNKKNMQYFPPPFSIVMLQEFLVIYKTRF